MLQFLKEMMDFKFLLTLSTLIGLFSLLKTLVVILRWVWGSFLRPKKDLKKYGSWAVVTGPTDGIGKATTFHLAREGLNLVLVGRSPAKLSSVSSKVRERFAGVEVRSIVCDFAKDLESGIKRIEQGIKDLDVGILINNVGTTYPFAMFLHEVDEKLIERVIGVNVVGTTKVTHAVLRGMVERKRGAIVNIGSGASSVLPSYPLVTVYSATKGRKQIRSCVFSLSLSLLGQEARGAHLLLASLLLN